MGFVGRKIVDTLADRIHRSYFREVDLLRSFGKPATRDVKDIREVHQLACCVVSEEVFRGNSARARSHTNVPLAAALSTARGTVARDGVRGPAEEEER